MAASIICGPCGYEDSFKNAKKWCSNCEEGFCEDCEKVHRSTKMSRNHTLISISDYHKIKDVSINQTCVGHGKRYDLYCSIHDKPICLDCVDQHKNCPQLVSLDNAAADAKQSTALSDLEDTINGALTNVERCIKSQNMVSKEFDQRESLIKKNIQETREKLNQHLDILEQKLIQSLFTKTAVCKSAYGKMLNQLNLADQKLSQIKEETETMKQMASDIQVFLGTREINKTVSEEIKSIKGIINSATYFEIEIEIDSSIASLLDCVDQLGIISVVERNSELEFKDEKIDQAQKQISLPVKSSNRVVNLKLKQKVKIKEAGIKLCVSGCLILSNSHILIADFMRKNQIMEFNSQGQYVRHISCSGDPYYLTLIDPDRIAVTFLSLRKIEIINLNNTCLKKIKLRNVGRGISYQDGKLYVIVATKGIDVFDLSGNIKHTLAIETSSVFNIATLKDRIYYTTDQKNTIHCLSLTGQEIWVYHNKSIIWPRGVTVADNQDVFVAGYDSNNLSIINQNGQESKILLHKNGDLIKPRAVFYSKDRKELLVCSEDDGTAAVYTVIVD